MKLDSEIFREISIKDFENIKVGNATDCVNGTGVTVLICEKGAPCGVDVRGGGPASRETTLLLPASYSQVIHALVLGGGSAYGLDAAGGVMKFLEEKKIGYEIAGGYVPLVVQSDIFDLTCGYFHVRPDQAMGYAACVGAYENNYQDGNYGCGTGATVGKYKGMEFCTKSGIGSYAIKCGDLKIGAVVCVNAVGNVFDENGKCIAGMINDSATAFQSPEEILFGKLDGKKENGMAGNTTIGAVLTNAKFDKSRLSKIASMSQNAYAKSIWPVHTSGDGDTIYALSLGEVEANIDLVGILAQEVMERAIRNAIYSSKSEFGIKCAGDLNF